MAELGRPLPDSDSSPRNPIILVLDNIRSLQNVGSLFRTADAFRCQQILLCGITGTPPHRDIHKAALGAEQSVPWQYITDTVTALQTLQSQGVHILALEQTDASLQLHTFHPDPITTYALVLGNEVEGVSDLALSLCTSAIEIEQFGQKHSLNVSVAGGIALYHLTKKPV
jgi:23S rRNA (guanosine2251-2'-O)-methyltransferase